MTRLKRFLATCQIPMLFLLQTIVPVIARCHDDIHFALSDWHSLCSADLQVFWKNRKKQNLLPLHRCLQRSSEPTRSCRTRLQRLKKRKKRRKKRSLHPASRLIERLPRCGAHGSVRMHVSGDAVHKKWGFFLLLSLLLCTFSSGASKSVVKESRQSGSRAPGPPK